MEPTTYTLTITVLDVPGILVRVAQVFARRGCNIRSLHVEPQGTTRWSLMTIEVRDVTQISQITRQLEKLVDVSHVEVAHFATKGVPKND
jgi:acetolactate synthase-1/3 small subunit